MYGLGTVVCICESDPIEKLDLEVIRQYCWFATKDMNKMDNSKKCNMLYWCYMTNHYNICGNGQREDPPVCLKAVIRKAYPSDDRWCKRFIPRMNKDSAAKRAKKRTNNYREGGRLG